MTLLRARPAATLVAWLSASASLAAEATTPAVFPAPPSAAVRMAPEEVERRYVCDGRPSGLPIPACSVPVGEQARNAYSASLPGLFAGAAQPPELELEVRVLAAEVDATGPGHAVLEHALTLRSRQGQELGHWRPRARERLVVLDAEGLALGFVRAARSNAAEWERTAGASPALAAWLGPRPMGRPHQEEAHPPPAVAQPRGSWVAFLDSGVMLVDPGGEREFGVGIRGGVSGRWVFAQLSGDYRRTSVTASLPPGFSPLALARVDAWSLGADVGGLLQLGQALEVRAGTGAHHASASGSVPYLTGNSYAGYFRGAFSTSRSRAAMSLFTSAHLVGGTLRDSRARGRFGLEVRAFLGSKAELPPLGLQTRLPTPVSITLVAGIELPVSRAAP